MILDSEEGEIYRNRKGYFSYNVQTISNYDLKINNIVARWPGSTHDQTIFNNSSIKSKFDAGYYRNSFLLGDSGYKNCDCLLTPLLETNNAAETLYNNCHIRTRNTVERQYGIWKRRFAILSLGMRVSNELSKIIIVATAVLHNIATDMKDPIPIGEDIITEATEAFINNDIVDNIVRRRLINNYFSTLL